jgi:hypothetical protein
MVRVIGAATFLLVPIAFAQTDSASQPGPKISPSPTVQQKAQNPQPGTQAQTKPSTTTVGAGKATLNNSTRSSTDYVDWGESIDIDGGGNVTTTDVAWDTKEKILYLSKNQTFACKNGNSADGQVLMAVYATGNTMARPAGSGWFVADLDEGECGVPTAGLYGCRFDASGNPTQCGAATLTEDDITVRPVSAK